MRKTFSLLLVLLFVTMPLVAANAADSSKTASQVLTGTFCFDAALPEIQGITTWSKPQLLVPAGKQLCSSDRRR